MFSRAAGGSSSAAAAGPAPFLGQQQQQGPYSSAADEPTEYDEQGRPASTSLPGVAFVNFRRRTVHAPGQFDDAGQAAGDECMFLQPSAASATGGSTMQFGSSRAGSCGGSPCSRAATKNSLSIPAWASTPKWAPAPGSPAGTAAHSTLAFPAASTAVCPSVTSSSEPSAPASTKRHSKPKWLQNVLKYATPRSRSPRSKQLQKEQQDAMLLAQEQQQQQEQHYLVQLQMQQQEQEQLQMQQQLAEQEELAFQQQLYEHGWDKLTEELQQQLREQFHEEFVLQLLQQEQLAHELAQLQAAYPDIDPAILQEQLMQQFQQAQEAQAQQQQQEFQSAAAAGPADVYEQHQQYEHLQQQLAGLQLPEHVQSLIQQHQQQQQQHPDDNNTPAGLPLQSQEFVYAGPAAEALQGSDQQQGGGPLVHVLDGPHGQVVQVTPDEFQDILTVMQALADARRDLAVRLQTSGGGQGTQGGTADNSSGPAAATDSDAGYQVVQVTAGDDVSTGGQQQAYAQQQEASSDARMLQDLNQGPPQVFLQDTGRSQSTGGRLEASAAAAGAAEKGSGLGVVSGWRASSSGRKAGRPNTSASAVKPTLFDFTPADPVHAEVHYMRAADQEDFRIKARPATCQGFPGSPTTLAKRNLQRSVAGSIGSKRSGPFSTRPQSAQGSVGGSNPGTPLSASATYLACAGSTVAGDDASSSSRGRTSMVSTIGSTVGSTVGSSSRRSAAGAAPRTRSASPQRGSSCLGATDEAVRESARVALQKYRAAFELMRLRDKSRSCSGWTDDDSPKPRANKHSPFSPVGTGGGAAGKSENETAIQMLTKKVAELEAGLSALLSGQAIPPAAAAALIAAISKMGVPSSQLIQALSKAGIKANSLPGNGSTAAASRGGSRLGAAAPPGSRNPSEGAALVTGEGKRAASNEAEAQPQGAAARQAVEELDSVIQTINQAQSQYEPPAKQKRRQKQEAQAGRAQQQPSTEAAPSLKEATGSASNDAASASAAPAPSAAPSQAVAAKDAQEAPEPATTAAAAREQPTGAAAAAASDGQEEAQESEEDMKRAAGAFDAAKFEAYSHKMTEDMARRAATNNYDSDVEDEEQQQQERAAAEEAAAAGGCSEEAAAAMKVLAEAEKKLKELHEQEVRLKALWAEQEEWMSSYRQPTAAKKASSKTTSANKEQQGDAASSQPPLSAAPSSDMQPKELVQAQAAADAAAARGLEAASQSAAAAAATAAAAAPPAAEAASNSSAKVLSSTRSKAAAALSPQEQAIISQRFVPTMSGEIPELAAVADAIVAGDIAAEESARMLGLMPPRDFDDGYAATAAGYMSDEGCKSAALTKHLTQQRRSASSGGCTDGGSLGGASGSEEGAEPGRSKQQKIIAAVKLEQDLELQACEQSARLNHRFTANPVPRSTRELRYHQLMAEQHAKRAATHQKYLQLLASQQQPFSFQQEDAEAAAAKAAKRAAAQDPNRFQRPFKAKPVPSHVHEAKYEAMLAAHEAAKTAAKVKAEMAKERVAKALEEDAARRSAAAASAYQERLGSPSIKPIKTRSTPRSSGGGSQKAVTPAGAAAGGKVPEQSAGSGSGSSSTAGSPGAPAGSSGQQLSRPKQQHAHPFAQADAAGKELQAAFPVLHTTYSTDGGVSEAGSGVLGSSLHSQALGSEASGQSASKGSRERSSGRKGSSSSAQSTPKSARRGTPRGGAGGAGAGVPDFKAMHEKWEAQQAAKKAANAKRTTVPEPPSFVTTPEEEEARAAERRAKVEEDMRADEARLTEQRWPFSSPRSPAKPAPIKTRPSVSGLYGSSYASYTPSLDSTGSSTVSAATAADRQSDGGCGSPLLARPPKPLRGAGQPGAHRETAAALLRAQATKQALLEGKFDTKEEKERKAQRAGEQEAEEKARRAADAASRAAKKKEMMHERSKLLQQLHDMKAQDAATSPTRQRALLAQQQQQLQEQQESLSAPSSPVAGGSASGTAAAAALAASPAAQPAAAAVASSAAVGATAAPAASLQQAPAPAAASQARAQAAATASEAPGAAEPQAASTPASAASQAAASPATGTATAAGAAAAAGALQAQQQQQQQSGSSGASMPTAAEVAAHLHKMLADDNARSAAASKEEQAAASRAIAEGLANSISNSASAASAASAAAAAASAAAAAAAAAAAGAAGAASCVAAASEQQLLGSRPASGMLAVETMGMSYVLTSGAGAAAAADRCLGAAGGDGSKVIPPVAAPAKAPTGLSLSWSNSLTSGGAGSGVKPLVPSVLPSSSGSQSGAQQGALGSRQSSTAGSCDVFASAEQAMELATAALAADRPAGIKKGAGAGGGAGAGASGATEPAVAAAAGAEADAAAAAAAAAGSKGASAAAAGGAAARTAPTAAAGPASFALHDISTARPASEGQQDEQEQEQEQQDEQQQTTQGREPRAAGRKGRKQLKPGAAAEPEPELVQVPPSFLSVKDRIKAINAAGKISPVSSCNGSTSGGREIGVVEPELSGSYKPCHGWGRSMGCATAVFSNNAASRAHVSLIDQLRLSQVGTVVERSSVITSTTQTVVERRRAPIEGRQDAPLMHIEARHQQAEARAKELVDEALRAHGIRKGYREVEEEMEREGGSSS